MKSDEIVSLLYNGNSDSNHDRSSFKQQQSTIKIAKMYVFLWFITIYGVIIGEYQYCKQQQQQYEPYEEAELLLEQEFLQQHQDETKNKSSYQHDIIINITASTTASSSTTKTKTISKQTDQLNEKQETIRNGVILLGMHRSGTSLLAGLLVHGFGYHVGGNIGKSAFDNKKGYFELLVMNGQNDQFMGKQGIAWNINEYKYNDSMALQELRNGKIKFSLGTKALSILNNASNIPYVQKDPRMCITLRTWLPLLNHEPAVVFTYRHPLEVTYSLMKRGHKIKFGQGLRLWIVYNMRAIQSMKGLCIVHTNNIELMSNAYDVIQRISRELTTTCNVPKPPLLILKRDVVNEFVDSELQHQNSSVLEKKIIATYDDDCFAFEIKTKSEPGTREYEIDKTLYLKAMEIFCHLKNGKAYQDDYLWPDINWFESLSR